METKVGRVLCVDEPYLTHMQDHIRLYHIILSYFIISSFHVLVSAVVPPSVPTTSSLLHFLCHFHQRPGDFSHYFAPTLCLLSNLDMAMETISLRSHSNCWQMDLHHPLNMV